MKTVSRLAVAFLGILLLSACRTVIQPEELYWKSEGVSLKEENKGFPDATYFGEGVEDNHFYPQETKAKYNKYQAKIWRWNPPFSFSYAYITLIGAPSYCKRCNNKRTIPCPECYGNKNKIKMHPCLACNENGYITVKKSCSECEGKKENRKWYTLWIGKFQCSECKGSGTKAIQKRCSKCKGKGKSPCCPNGRGYLNCDKCSSSAKLK